MPKDGIQLYRDIRGDGRATKHWVLSIIREAKEKDLEENHHLEMIGDTIWETHVSVKHCPYCGLKLPGFEEEEEAESVWFEHYDRSGWKTKVQ